ncbi:hypothetical protein SORBI_3010G107800 [Sorghum bicolor]|uniref:Uncharacterized protein n=1 Tax=Sorghum bicolor TaxID=4558 RepID=A0A194YID7_SORBI|nr:hypothetical protein SORBI_3010G107800 [Sorghum bicolor]
MLAPSTLHVCDLTCALCHLIRPCRNYRAMLLVSTGLSAAPSCHWLCLTARPSAVPTRLHDPLACHRHHRRVLHASSSSNRETVVSPHQAASPPFVCSLRHCIYIAVTYGLMIVLRNPYYVICLHQVFVVLIGSLSLSCRYPCLC